VGEIWIKDKEKVSRCGNRKWFLLGRGAKRVNCFLRRGLEDFLFVKFGRGLGCDLVSQIYYSVEGFYRKWKM
jgi:hypothetical protein